MQYQLKISNCQIYQDERFYQTCANKAVEASCSTSLIQLNNFLESEQLHENCHTFEVLITGTAQQKTGAKIRCTVFWFPSSFNREGCKHEDAKHTCWNKTYYFVNAKQLKEKVTLY